LHFDIYYAIEMMIFPSKENQNTGSHHHWPGLGHVDP